MAKLVRISLLTALMTAAALTAGCSTVSSLVSRGNVFRREDPAVAAAARAGRVPLVASSDVVTASADLLGREFTLPAAAPRTDWPLPGGTPEQSVGHVEAAPAFRVAWRSSFGAGSGKTSHVTAPPVSADGRIFVMDGYAGVRAIDAATGRTVWRANLRNTGRRDARSYGGGVAYAGGKLYVSSGYRFVAQLDAATGRVEWRTATPGPMRSAPSVSGGRVFAIDNNNGMMAFDAASGQSIWDYQALTESARILSATSPAIVGDTVIAAFSSGEVVRLRAANGAEFWTPQPVSRSTRTSALTEIRDIAGRPVVYDGTVYAAGHSGVTAALDLLTGQARWRQPIASITTPLPVGDVIYVVSRAGELFCLSRADGRAYWIRDLNAGRKVKDRAIFTGPVLASGRLIVGSSRGEAIAIDAKTGAVQNTIRVGSPVLIPPIAVGGRVYMVTDSATLVAIG